ncbi:MAG: SDR family oxidoreductase [Pseudomonadota bacterium]|mgnify:CR=1 FL=1|nr:SDR family oxidoreductase [Pseudomonadota bacterium]
MELGIKGKKAIVCASSKGLGRGCAISLAREGVDVTICARGSEKLKTTADEIRSIGGGKVNAITCDITTSEGQKTILETCPEPDILVNNAGGPPPGDFRDWDREAWISAIDANMLTPIFLIKAVVDGMIERKFGRIINITSGAVKAPIENLGLSNGARSGLTGFIAGISRKTISANVTINNLLPGPFETERLHANLKAAAEKASVDIIEFTKKKTASNPAGRFGDPEEFGEYCAFLCSQQAGYVTGQNILMDGGNYPGTF